MTDNPEQPAGPRPLPFEALPPTNGKSDPPPGQRHEVADDREHKLDPRSVMASRLAGMIWVIVLAAVALIPTLVVPFASGLRTTGWLVVLASWLTFAVLLTLLVVTWPPLRYRYASYRVNDLGIRIRTGVVFRSVVSVPRSRVQHTDVSRGPLERNFGLASLVIHTAGTQHASVHLGGLSENVADAIRDFLIEGGEDDAV